MSSRMRHAVQIVIGLGLAAVLLVWGLPHFAKSFGGDAEVGFRATAAFGRRLAEAG